MAMPARNGENPQFYGQWTVEDSKNVLCAKSLPRQRILSAWNQGLLTLKIQRNVPPEIINLGNSQDEGYF